VRRAADVTLSPTERVVLEQWAAAQGSSRRLTVRAQIVLQAAGGRTNGEIARTLGIHPETVSRWRNRFVVNRLDGLRRDAPRSGARAPPSVELTARILRATLEEPPPSGDRWTTRTLGRALQVSHMRVYRVWKAHGVALPGRSAHPISPLPPPEPDLAGIYLDQPAAAAVFSVARPTHPSEFTRNVRAFPVGLSGGFLFADPGIVPASLVEVLASAEELVPRIRSARRSPHELLVFLRTIEEATGPDSQLHLILDRPLTFLPGRVAQWLAAHPRFRVYGSGASNPWTTSVGDWLQTWRGVPLSPGSFGRVAEFTEAIARAVGSPQPRPRRFSWTLTTGLKGEGASSLSAPRMNSRGPPSAQAPARTGTRPTTSGIG
jgi:transposase-like protein